MKRLINYFKFSITAAGEMVYDYEDYKCVYVRK